jgi:SulP family sulfate permease
MFHIIKEEFKGYNASVFQKDLLAGLTVGAVALPLALAFGIASGADAPAGLVTAILAGILIGSIGGGSFQISGPTGAMSAILILIATQVGLKGVWIAGVLSGVIILLIGTFRLGRIISIIPSSVITGFTSGIAVIIFVGQLPNFFGTPAPKADSALEKTFEIFAHQFQPNWQTVLIGALVFGIIFLLPKSINKRIPGSLLGIIVAAVIAEALGFNVPRIGEIPRQILLDKRLQFADLLTLTSDEWSKLILPAVTIAALGAIESLLCGAVCSKMTGRPMHNDHELIAQGIGNIVIPFFGGVPATAAIARSSVGVKSGGQTRLVSIIHALVLLAAAFVFAPLLGRVPLSALAGVLMATAIRMNEWNEIRWMFRHRFKGAIITFLITLLATAHLDLTQAIIIGIVISAGLFIYSVSNIDVNVKPVDAEIMRARGFNLTTADPETQVAYVTGPMFFGTTAAFRRALAVLPHKYLILSMRGVPAIDVSGLELMEELYERMHKQGGKLMLAAVQPAVRQMLVRGGLMFEIGEKNVFWSADQAILATHQS